MLVLDRAGCERIHAAALEVLSEVGVRVDDPEIVKMMQDAGATVVGENIVRIPEQLVRWALEKTPKSFKMADRAGRTYDLRPGGDTMVLTGNALYVTRGKVRSDLSSTDLAELARIVDACDNIHGMVGTAVVRLSRLRPGTSSASRSWRRTPPSISGPASSRLGAAG